jgi:hypothetical protein
LGLEGLEGEWGAIVRRDVLVVGCGAYSIVQMIMLMKTTTKLMATFMPQWCT